MRIIIHFFVLSLLVSSPNLLWVQPGGSEFDHFLPAALGKAQVSEINADNTRQAQAESVFKKRYENFVYGYTVKIPRGLTARSVSPPLPQHGFVITLSQRNKSELDVDASYNAADWHSLADAFDYSFQELANRSEFVNILEKKQIRWHGRQAIKFTLRYRDKKFEATQIKSSVIGFRKCPGEYAEIVYSITLYTAESRFARDKTIMNQILSSMKMHPHCG